ncbi:MAG: leucine-rich repeat protein [Lachnospiraceae bacterium]|nr:leucine-rich repeat protein [Lachnospiraceae bacterium]
MKKRMWGKALALLLAASMVTGIVPVDFFATGAKVYAVEAQEGEDMTDVISDLVTSGEDENNTFNPSGEGEEDENNTSNLPGEGEEGENNTSNLPGEGEENENNTPISPDDKGEEEEDTSEENPSGEEELLPNEELEETEEDEPSLEEEEKNPEETGNQPITIEEKMKNLRNSGEDLYAVFGGKVVSKEEQTPIEGVSVSLYDMDYMEIVGSAYTDSDGNWTCGTTIQGNSYILRFHSPYYSFEENEIECEPQGEGTEIVVETVEATMQFDPDTEETSVDYFTYRILEGNLVRITAYNGSASEVVIPNIIDGKEVYTIDENVFKNHTELKKVILPGKLRTINTSAFEGCTSLEYIGFNDELITIGQKAFEGCTGLATIDLPNSLREIGYRGFAQCSGINQVKLPESVDYLGAYCFYNNISLQEINIPIKLEECKEYKDTLQTYRGIFKGCSNLTQMEVPWGMKNLPDNLFAGADYLTKVSLPETLQSIGSYSFSDATVLSEIVLPNTITEIKKYAFKGSILLQDITWSENLKIIGNHSFEGCTSLKEVTFPGKVEEIGISAFQNCTNLTKAILPDSVTILGGYAFGNCTLLAEVTIGKNLSECKEDESVLDGRGPFRNCTSLTSATLPEGMTSLPKDLFYKAEALQEIQLPSTLKRLEESSISYCTSLENIILPTGLEYIGTKAFQGCSALAAIEIPEGVTEIAVEAFGGNSSLTNVTLPDTLTTLWTHAFEGCTSLTEIEIPASLEKCSRPNDTVKYPYGVFSGCTNLTEVTFASGLKKVPDYMFCHSTNLITVNFPAGLEEIGTSSFRDCVGITKLELPNSLSVIGKASFQNCLGLTQLTVPSNVTKMKANAFTGCEYLTTVSLPDGMETIEAYAFSDCVRLKTINIPSGLKECKEINTTGFSTERGLFSGCTRLTQLTIPSGMTEIPANLLYSTPGLKEIILHDEVLVIGAYAFGGCNSLVRIWVGDNVHTIHEKAFTGCENLTIHGVADSAANTYASTYGFTFSTEPLALSQVTLEGRVVEMVEVEPDQWEEQGISGIEVLLYDVTAQENIAELVTDSEGTWEYGKVTKGHGVSIRYNTKFYSLDQDYFYLSSAEKDQEITKVVGESILSKDVTETPAEDFTYETIGGNYIRLTSYVGSDREVVIPSEVDGKTVKEIGSNTFSKNTTLQKVIMPDTVVTVGTNAFSGCTSLEYIGFSEELLAIESKAFQNCVALEELKLPNKVTEIRNFAFDKCSNLKKVNLPDTVELLGAYAFGNCSSLSDINIPYGLMECTVGSGLDEKGPFRNCTSLTKVTVPEGITVLPAYLFYQADAIQNISLPSTLKKIGNYAFYGCDSITAIALPKRLEQIGTSSFGLCNGLTELEIPQGMIKIWNSAFSSCSNLQKVYLPDSLITLNEDAFSNCKKLEEINIPKNLQECNGGVFKNCSSLTEVTIPEGMEILPNYLFADASSLKSVSLPEGLKELGTQSFYKCTGLSGIKLPNSLTTIGSKCFALCKGFTGIEFPKNLTTIGAGAFSSCEYIEEIELPEGLTTLGTDAFSDCIRLKNVVLPSTLANISGDGGPFRDCTKITRMELTDTMTRLPDRLFYQMPELKVVIVPDSVVEIGEKAFQYCKKLAHVWVGKNVAKIVSNAFNYCPELTIHGEENSVAQIYANEHTIPFSTQRINLSFVSIEGNVQDSLGNGIKNIEVSIYDLDTQSVVECLTDADGNWEYDMASIGHSFSIRYNNKYYRFDQNYFYLEKIDSHTVLETVTAEEILEQGLPATPEEEFTITKTNGEFATITSYDGAESVVVIPEVIDGCKVTTIGKSAFEKNKTLETVILPDSITSIAERAFYECSKLKEVGFGEELLTIGKVAFYNCVSLERIVLPNKVTTLGEEVFYKCTKLETVELPDSITMLNNRVFAECSSLKEVNIPLGTNGMLMGSSIFYKCTALTQVTIPQGMTHLPGKIFDEATSLQKVYFSSDLEAIGNNSFARCKALTSIAVPEGVTSIGNAAFSNCTGLTQIELPESLKSLGDSTFNGCTGLTQMVLPDGLTTMGSYTFQSCTNLSEINIPMKLTSVGSNAVFYKCTSLTEVTLPVGMKELPDYLFKEASSLKKVNLPDGLKSIGVQSFYQCIGLAEVSCPSTLKEIKKQAFDGCKGLTCIELNDGLQSIGARAFAVCTNLTQVVIPDSVTGIALEAFRGCSVLREVQLPVGLQSCPLNGSSTSVKYSVFYECPQLINLTLPEGLTTIPDYMFARCSSLVSIVLPDSLENIGNYAFQSCTSLGALDMGENVKNIGSYAFDGCSILEDVILSRNITSIGGYAFRNCVKLQKIELSSRLKSIGMYTFYGTAIQEIEIPAGVSKILEKTFAECKQLEKITIKRNVESISADAFSNTDKDLLTIYCYEGSKAHEYAINYGFKFVIMEEPVGSNGSEISNKVTIVEGTDVEGNVVQMKFVVADCETTWPIYPSTISYENGRLYVEHEDYNTIDIPDCKLDISTTMKIGMVRKNLGSGISAVHCKGKDALISNVYAYSDKDNTAENKFEIFAYAAVPEEEIERYELMIDLATIATSEDGYFKLDMSSLPKEKNLYVRLVTKQGEEYSIRTNIAAKEQFSSDYYNSKFSLGSMTKFKIPKDVAYIGGGEIELDLSFVPVVFELDGDTFKVGFGCKETLFESNNGKDSGKEWSKWKKAVDEIGTNIAKGMVSLHDAKIYGSASLGPDEEFTFKAYGYVEGKLNPESLDAIGGKIVVSVSGKVGDQTQTWVGIIPCVVQFELEAGVDTSLGIGFDLKTEEMYFVGTAKFTAPKVNLKGGVGMAYVADVSTYGETTNEIYFETEHDTVTAMLKGESGVSASLLGQTYKKALHEKDYIYYHKSFAKQRTSIINDVVFEKGYQEMESFSYDRSYLADMSSWNSNGVIGNSSPLGMKLASNSTQTTVQSHVYPSSDPQLVVNDAGQLLMVWTGDVKERSTGNHTAIMYSFYQSTEGAWSEPQIIWDDGTADYYPSVVANGNDFYVAWTNGKEANLHAGSTLEEVSEGCEISVAKYENGKFITQTITQNTTLDVKPQLACVGDQVYVAWVNNLQNDVYTLQGTNQIYYAVFENDQWKKNLYATVEGPVTSVTIGAWGTTPSLAWIKDADADMATMEDHQIYVGSIGETASALEVSGTLSNLQFANNHGQNILTWYQSNGIGFALADGTIGCFTAADDATLNGDYTFVNLSDGTYVLYTQGKEEGSEIYARKVLGTQLSAAMKVTNCGEYIKNYSVCSTNQGLNMAYTRTTAIFTAGTIEELTDMCTEVVGNFEGYQDLSVDAAEYDAEQVVGGGLLPVTLSLTNHGVETITQIQIAANKGTSTSTNNAKTYDVEIKSGETKEVVVDLLLAGEITETTQYTFVVKPKNGKNADTTNDVIAITIGFADISLQADCIRAEEKDTVVITLNNYGQTDTDVYLYVKDGNEKAAVLGKYYVGKVAAGAEELYTLDYQDMISQYNNSSDILYFEAVAVEEETNLSNNSGFVVLSIPTFTVTFDPCGGICQNNSKEIMEGGFYGVLPTASRMGYRFLGWFTAETGGGKITENTPYNLTEDSTLYAHWEREEYTFTWNANGGNYEDNTAVKTSKTYYDETFLAPSDPVRVGYTFAGWYTATDGGNYVDTSKPVDFTESTTFYAKWNPKVYQIRYLDYGSLTDCSAENKEDLITTYTYGQSVTLVMPTKEDYTATLYTDAQCQPGGEITSIGALGLTADTVLYIKWTPKEYHITYVLDGGETTNPTTYTKEDEFTLSAPTKKEMVNGEEQEFVFAGWYTLRNGSAGSYTFENRINQIEKGTKGDLTIYAQWLPAGTKAYSVTFMNNGHGEDVEGLQEQIFLPETLPIPEEVGYTFQGWYQKMTIDPDTKEAVFEEKDKVEGGERLEEDITLYAFWTVNTYPIKYFDQGTQVHKDEFLIVHKYGIATPLPIWTKEEGGITYLASWHLDSEEGEVVEELGAYDVTSVVNLHARWQPCEEGTTISIQFAGVDEEELHGIYAYTGNVIKPQVIVKDRGVILEEGKDYTLRYKNNKVAATLNEAMAADQKAPLVTRNNAPQIIIKGKGNYAGGMTITKYFTISARTLSDENVTVNHEDSMAAKVRNGNYVEQQLDLTVKYNHKTLVKGKDYVLTYDYLGMDGNTPALEENLGRNTVKEPGVYKVHIHAAMSYNEEGQMIRSNRSPYSNANYIGEREGFILYVTKEEIPMSQAKITLGNKGKHDYGKEVTLQDLITSVKCGTNVYSTETAEKRNEFNSVFDVFVLDSKTNTWTKDVTKATQVVGQTTLKVEAKAGSGYRGSKMATVNIIGIPLSKVAFRITEGDTGLYTYNKKAQYPTYNLYTATEVLLTEGRDYAVTYKKGREEVTRENLISAGTYQIVFTGRGGYTGSVTKSFQITPLDLAKNVQNLQVILEKDSVPYSAGGCGPEVELLYTTPDGTIISIDKTDYNVSYGNHTKPALKTDKNAPFITIRGANNCKGYVKNIANYSIMAKSFSSKDITLTVSDAMYKNGKVGARRVQLLDQGKAISSKYYKITYVVKGVELDSLKQYQLPERGYDYIEVRATAKAGGNYIENSYVTAKLHVYTQIISKASVTLEGGPWYYTGKKVTPKIGKVLLTNGEEIKRSAYDGYTVTYGENVKVGVGTIKINGTGSYGGSKTVKFNILARWKQWTMKKGEW